MAYQPISQHGPTVIDEYRAQAGQWSGQLGKLFGWLLVIEFGLVSVVLGFVSASWPQTPEFLASATGAWLLLLAGCRGFAAFAGTRGDTSRNPARQWPRLVAAADAALCVGTGFVLLHADWPSRPAAIPIALTFAAVVVAACGVIDIVAARFGPGADVRLLMVRAGGWLVAAMLLLGLLNVSVSAALACAAVIVGAVEVGTSGWQLRQRANVRRPDTVVDSVAPEPLLGFLTEE
jgi:hypothetical protein